MDLVPELVGYHPMNHLLHYSNDCRGTSSLELVTTPHPTKEKYKVRLRSTQRLSYLLCHGFCKLNYWIIWLAIRWWIGDYKSELHVYLLWKGHECAEQEYVSLNVHYKNKYWIDHRWTISTIKTRSVKFIFNIYTAI